MALGSCDFQGATQRPSKVVSDFIAKSPDLAQYVNATQFRSASEGVVEARLHSDTNDRALLCSSQKRWRPWRVARLLHGDDKGLTNANHVSRC